MIDPAQSAVDGRRLDFLLLPALTALEVFTVSATEGDRDSFTDEPSPSFPGGVRPLKSPALDEAINRLVNKGGDLDFRGESSDVVLDGASTA